MPPKATPSPQLHAPSSRATTPSLAQSPGATNLTWSLPFYPVVRDLTGTLPFPRSTRGTPRVCSKSSKLPVLHPPDYLKLLLSREQVAVEAKCTPRVSLAPCVKQTRQEERPGLDCMNSRRPKQRRQEEPRLVSFTSCPNVVSSFLQYGSGGIYGH